jgi:hypothetical protein
MCAASPRRKARPCRKRAATDDADQPDPAFLLQREDCSEVALVDRGVQLVVQQGTAGLDVRDIEEVLVRAA